MILLVGGRQVIDGTLTLGDFTAFYAYLLMLIGPMRQLGIALGLAQRATASGARLFELLDREPRLTQPEDAQPLPPGRRAGGAARRHVLLSRGARPRCGTCRSSSRRGSTVALVGATGSGKSTLVRLIPRLYDPDSGSVLVDGADVRGLDLRRAAARDRGRRRRPVPVLRHGRGRTSPTGGRTPPARTSSRGRARAQAAELHRRAARRLRHARRRARAHALGRPAPAAGDRARPAGRPAHPRARRRDLGVDASTEQAIKDALREVMAGRTTFVIAHRLSTIALADEIVVLEDGRIAARGTHEELVVRSALYAEIAAKGLPDPVFLDRSGRWSACEPAPRGPARRAAPPPAPDQRARAQAARAHGAAAPLPRPHDADARLRCCSPRPPRSRRRRWPSWRSTTASRRATSPR